MSPRADSGKSDRGDEPGELRRGLFWLADTGPFHGYTFGAKWNGWDVPFFPRDESEKISRVLAPYGGPEPGTYDGDGDAFVWTDPEDPEDFEPLVFKGESYGVGVLYPIGAAYWTWKGRAPEAPAEARDGFVADPTCDCGYEWPDEGAVE